MPKIPAGAQATKGTRVSWAEGVTAGVLPTTGFVDIGGITSFPQIGGASDSFETTTIDEDFMKTYCMGLIDPGGAQDVTVNFCKEVIDVMADIQVAQLAGKEIWIKEVFPAPVDVTCTFTGQFSPLAAPPVAINGVLQGTISMTYSGYFKMLPTVP